ncbi:MAG: hypothetical protein KKH98_14510 [Spirochaetes bacterium]|nr:hypothetical protein [Spirochaetota bacterium]
MAFISFNKRVDEFYWKYFLLALFYAFTELFLILGIWFFLFALIDNILNFNIFFRYLNLIGFLFFSGRRGIYHYHIIKEIDRRSLLIQIEDRHRFNDTIISSYELQGSKEYKDEYLSGLFKQAFSNLLKVHFSSLVDNQKLKNNYFFFISTLLFFILYSTILSYNYSISFNRFINPEFRIKYSHKLAKQEIWPGNIRILEGRDVKIRLTSFGKVKEAFLVLQNENNIIREKLALSKKTNIATNDIYIYDYLLKSVYDNFAYYGETIQTRDNIPIKTPEYKINVVKEPIVTSMKLVVIHPHYTRLKPKIIEDNGNVEAVERAVIKISGRVNNNLKRASLYYNNRRIDLSVSDDSFSGRFMLFTSGRYYLKFKDENNNTNSSPVNYSVIAIKDNPPDVEIVNPGRDVTLSDNPILPLEILARDDYAVNDLKLLFRVKKAFVDTKTEWKEIDFNIPGSPYIDHKYIWDLNDLNFIPGDMVEYYARAYDGYKPAKDHIAVSKKYIIKFPTMDEMYRQVNKEHSQQYETVESILEKQKEIYNDTGKLLQDMEGKNELSFIMKKEMEQMKENQQKISESIQKLTEKISQSQELMKKKDLFSLDIIKKMDAIQKLLKEVGDKQIEESLQKLNQALKNINLSQVKRNVLSQKLTQEKILKRLEKTLEMLKDLKNKKRMEGLKKVADELIKKQSELLNETLQKKAGTSKEKTDSNQLKAKQEQLKQMYDQLQKEMKQFGKELEQEGSDLKDGVKQANESMDKQNIEKDFDQSINSLEKSELSKSAKDQKKIISKLNSMSKNFSKMQMQSQQMDITKLLNIFDETIFNMLKASEKVELYHEKMQYKLKILENFFLIRERSSQLYDVDDYAEIAEDLIFLERNIRTIGKNMEEQTKVSLIISPEFFKKFETIGDSLANARTYLGEKRTYDTTTHLAKSLMENNIILRELLKLKEDFKDQMEMQASQGMGDSLNQIAGAQEKLNEMTQRLEGQTGKSKMSTETQEYLEELAFQQEMIKKNLENFLNNYKQADKLLGDLGSAAKEMNEVKKSLESKKIDKDVIKKQKQVLKRLLDSERSLHVEDKSKKRESETAKAYEVQPPSELEKEKVEYKSKIYYYQHIDKYPMEYKKLIDDYFKVLNSLDQQ